MRSNQDIAASGSFRRAARQPGDAQRSCYGIQVLVAGRRKHWRDDVSAQVRRAGFNAIMVDSAVDALTVLALGLPLDVLVTDAHLQGALCCSQLAAEARLMRPNLGIVLASDMNGGEERAPLPPDCIVMAESNERSDLARTVREALAVCAS